jgi:hypothetical protein
MPRYASRRLDRVSTDPARRKRRDIRRLVELGLKVKVKPIRRHTTSRDRQTIHDVTAFAFTNVSWAKPPTPQNLPSIRRFRSDASVGFPRSPDRALPDRYRPRYSWTATSLASIFAWIVSSAGVLWRSCKASSRPQGLRRANGLPRPDLRFICETVRRGIQLDG